VCACVCGRWWWFLSTHTVERQGAQTPGS
jgi:hypothetical protein